MAWERLPGSGPRFVARGVRRARRSPGRYNWHALALVAAIGLAGLADAAHTVVPGESLWKIARRYGSAVDAIAGANALSNPNLVFPGQVLRIPGPDQPAASAPAGVPAASPPGPSVAEHRVRPGENLTEIALLYGTTVGVLIEMNGIRNPNLVRIGRVLMVPVPSTPTVEELLESYSRLFGVDPVLVKAIAWQESGWRQEVTSSAGAIGVMQVIPATGEFAGRRLLGHDVDLFHVDHNIKAGVRFLAWLLELNDGDEELAVAGYFQGPRSVQVNGVSPRTHRYVANVFALRQRFQA